MRKVGKTYAWLCMVVNTFVHGWKGILYVRLTTVGKAYMNKGVQGKIGSCKFAHVWKGLLTVADGWNGICMVAHGWEDIITVVHGRKGICRVAHG